MGNGQFVDLSWTTAIAEGRSFEKKRPNGINNVAFCIVSRNYDPNRIRLRGSGTQRCP